MLPSGLPWQIVMVMAVLAAPPSPSSDLDNRGLNESEVGGCLVSPSLKVDQPSEVPLLAYVSRSVNVILGFTYNSSMPMEEREAISLNSTGATHSKNGQNWRDVALSRLIPEGWNTFLLKVAGERVTVTLVQGEEWLTLLMMKMPLFITTVYAEGTVALCRPASPKWEVFPEEEVEVVLQPWSGGRAQWVEVSGTRWGAAAPYITFPSAPSTKIPVPSDTLLRITTNLRGDHVLLKLFKMRSEHPQMQDRDGGEVVAEAIVPVTHLLIMLVGDSGDGGGSGEGGGGSGDGASIHLRLLLSLPPVLTTSVTNENIKTETTWSTGRILTMMVKVVLVVTAVLLAEAVARVAVVPRVLRFRKRRKSECLLDPREEMSGSGSDDKVPINNPDRAETPRDLSTLIQEFEDRLIYTENKTAVVYLHGDNVTPRLLHGLHKNISEVELLDACVLDASEFCCPYHLPSLPDAEKVNLDVAGVTNGDLYSVRQLVEMLQPQNGYSRIDFRGGSNGGTMETEDWETLLNFLSESKIKVKDKVYLPPNAVDEEHRLNLSFSYECRTTDQ